MKTEKETLMLYMDERLKNKIRRESKKEGKSMTSFVVDLLKEATKRKVKQR